MNWAAQIRKTIGEIGVAENAFEEANYQVRKSDLATQHLNTQEAAPKN
ncbi:hypothetical protein LYZ37_07515 [Vibrio tubiashii]|nr:hypothetical protein [Vibrio tubiashii]WCP68566.1 hypothetical protein LYZ37_07515 [Vibrio tubiashii]